MKEPQEVQEEKVETDVVVRYRYEHAEYDTDGLFVCSRSTHITHQHHFESMDDARKFVRDKRALSDVPERAVASKANKRTFLSDYYQLFTLVSVVETRVSTFLDI